jgi:biotin operon repressor
MRKDVREFIRRLEPAGLTVESTPGHYRVLHDRKPLRVQAVVVAYQTGIFEADAALKPPPPPTVQT